MNQNEFKLINGVWLPRVTHILNIISKGKAYENWLKKNTKEESEKLSQEALDKGSGWHNWLERVGLGEELDPALLPEIEQKWGKAFLEWVDLNVKRFIEVERAVYTDGYCGTLDSVVELKDHKIALLDYKTSRHVYDTYSLQVSAYRHAYQNMTKTPIDTAFILRFDKSSGKMEVKEIVELDYHYNIFQHALELWRWKNKEVLNGLS